MVGLFPRPAGILQTSLRKSKKEPAKQLARYRLHTHIYTAANSSLIFIFFPSTSLHLLCFSLSPSFLASYYVLLSRVGGNVQLLVESCKRVVFSLVCSPPPVMEYQVVLWKQKVTSKSVDNWIPHKNHFKKDLKHSLTKQW